MIGQEGRYVEDLAVDHNLDVIFLVVLGDVLESEGFC